MVKNQPYANNGVLVSKSSISQGDNIEVSYKGLLVECGASEVYIHGGYGDNWEDNFLLPMTNDGSEFKVNFKVSKAGNLNMTFRDNAFNWDNNSAENYTFSVKGKVAAGKAKKEADKESEKETKKEAKKEVKKETKTTKAKTSTTEKAVKKDSSKPKNTKK